MLDSVREQRIQHAGFFVLRSPLLPFDALIRGDGHHPLDSITNGSARESDSPRKEARRWLHEMIQDPAVSEAIVVASPDLFERVSGKPQDLRPADAERAELAVLRYIYRMAGRATPFGLFASCSLGTIEQSTHLIVPDRTALRRHIRLDAELIRRLGVALGSRDELHSCVRFFANDTIYCVDDHTLRYVQAESTSRPEDQTYRLSAVRRTPYLDKVLDVARGGATIDTIAGVLAQQGAGSSEIREYVDALVQNEILVAGLAPRAADDHAGASHLIGELLEAGAEYDASLLAGVVTELEKLNSAPLGLGPADYARATVPLQQLLSNDPAAGTKGAFNSTRAVHVDLIRDAPALRLGRAIIDEIVRGIHLLHRLGSTHERDALVRFRQAFVERYAGRTIPLMIALDEDVGVGFPDHEDMSPFASPELAFLQLPERTPPAGSWTERDQVLLAFLARALNEREIEARLKPAEVEDLASRVAPRQPLPDTIAAKVTVVAASDVAIAGGHYSLLLEHVNGPSGARPLGRFCASDLAIRDKVARFIVVEEQRRSGDIIAEVGFLPRGRAGNVALQPRLRTHVIPVLSGSSSQAPGTIALSDLGVRVDGKRVLLWSSSHDCQVVPRITSMHAGFHPSNPNIYRFLHAIQFQGVAAELSWSWGAIAAAPFLPRVRYGRLVLARARWRLGREDLEPLSSMSRDSAFSHAQTLRKERGLPRWVTLAEGDNHLPVDLNNALSVDSLVKLLKGRSDAVLTELYPPPEEMCAIGPEGRFVHEIYMPFSVLETSPTAASTRRGHLGNGNPQVRRTFPAGSEWLYLKVYSGPAMIDRLLREAFSPVLSDLDALDAIDSWFFVRYADPDFHLRLRLHGPPPKLLQDVLTRIRCALDPYVTSGTVYRLDLGTYEREIERYGGASAISLAELFFHADSVSVLSLLQEPDAPTVSDRRLELGILGCDALLSDFGYDTVAKARFMASLRSDYGAELNVSSITRARLGNRFRQWRTWLEAALGCSAYEHPAVAMDAAHKALTKRSQTAVLVQDELLKLERADKLTAGIPAILRSFVHMYLNRVLRSNAREHELVIYDYLARYYGGRVARAENNNA